MPDSDKGKISTIDVAALLGATRDQGDIDVAAFHARRTILRHETIGGVDAEALAASLTMIAPMGAERDAIINAALGLLDEANAERLKLELASWRDVSPPVVVAGQTKPGRWPAILSIRSWFRPRLGSRTRWPESKHLSSRSMTRKRMAQSRARTVEAYSLLAQYVDPERFRAEFLGNRNFRQLVLGMALMYGDLDKIVADLARNDIGDPIRTRAVIVLKAWVNDLQATTGMEEKQYIADSGETGVDAAICAVPAAEFWKFAGMARSYFEAGIDMKDPAVIAATSDAARLIEARHNSPSS